ncbi:MAG: hypothetical protein ACOY4I_04760 [Bacillota bacterium]
MEIGRRVFYDKDTGVILAATAERKGDVVETSIMDDMRIFLPNTPPEEVECIELQYGELNDQIVEKHDWFVDLANKQIKIIPRIRIQVVPEQIPPDGMTDAVATVTLPYGILEGQIIFKINDSPPVAIDVVEGSAIFRFNTTIAGAYYVTATSNINGSVVAKVVVVNA